MSVLAQLAYSLLAAPACLAVLYATYGPHLMRECPQGCQCEAAKASRHVGRGE